MKSVKFHPAALSVIQRFPREVKKELGKAIFHLQNGVRLGMPLSKPMPSVGSGVEELRVKDASGAFRVFYITKVGDEILVFHAFKKKSQRTLKRDIDLGKKRLKELRDE